MIVIQEKGRSSSRKALYRAALLTAAAVLSMTTGHQAAWAQALKAPSLEESTGDAGRATADKEAQDTSQPVTSSAGGSTGDIVITGSRIVRDGYSSPTPVTVLGQAEIQAQAPANIADFVNQLPGIVGSATAASNSIHLSNGIAGINSVNLRGLGSSRTLVLLDGQRSVASAVDGTVDINTFPQELVERVEVVTGGASAQYGSDAVGGVVNFILDKKFRGFKVNFDQGISTYGDGPNYKATATAGFSALQDRLHVLLDASYFRQYGVDSIDRPWNSHGYFQINNPAYTATNGQPQRLVGSGFGPATYTKGGLITSGPLRGTYFLGDGTTGTLNFGVTNSVSSPWMIGGDWQTTLDGHVGTNSLIPDEERIGVFNRTTYDIADNIHVYGQFSWNRYHGWSYYMQTPSTGVTIRNDNAYLLSQYPGVAAALAASGQTSFSMGTSNDGFPEPGTDNLREVFRYVAGANGDFMLGSRKWSWDAYFQHGVTKAHEELTNTWNLTRMSLAQDAVFAPAGNAAGIPTGTIVCRSTLTNPGNGCVPLDRLGTGGVSSAALVYIYGAQPYRDETLKEDVASVAVNGQLFDLPDGPVSIAFGGDWRREQISGYVPPEFEPVFNADGTTTNDWLYGNYLPTSGHYDVKEGFVEVDLPIIWKIDVNAAGRYTDYSTSGAVQTWKVGATYEPIPDVKFRGTYSHDIRAPNLSELFAAGTARTNSVILPDNSAIGPGSFQFVESTIGNLNLKPETANTWTAGVVVTPRFIPGFSASFDYYDIKITNAIGSISSQSTVDNCYNLGLQSYCNNIVYQNGALSQIILQPFNFASQHEKGFDIEASYRTSLSTISSSLPGDFSIHGLLTHYIENVSDNGVFPVDQAGVDAGGEPSWVYRVSAFYNLSPFTFNLVARGFSSGVYGNDFIQCTVNCPTSTTQYRTINDNHIDGTMYLDASIGVTLHSGRHESHLTFIVDNLTNRAPVLVGNGPSGNDIPAEVQTSRSLYDVVGRVFRLSIGLKL